MKHNVDILVLIIFSWQSGLCELVLPEANGLVVSNPQYLKQPAENAGPDNDTYVNPKIYAMDINTNITNRYARTLITSKVSNLEQLAAETTFLVILPEDAFISEFSMEIDGEVYKARVIEKEEAKQIYKEAVSKGQSAGHVEVNPRNSKIFTISLNIEPESKTIFRLTYEELLQRQIGQYELVVNIYPGQIVNDLNVEVQIKESRPLRFVRTPALRTGNEISKNEVAKLNPESEIAIVNTSAVVKFIPDKSQQKNFAQFLGKNPKNGLAGQFVVQYDVERDPQGGEVLIRDGYFVQFFSPSGLEPLRKHVVFVLDHSGSMEGRKIQQLTDAMQNILPQLHSQDLFSLVRFSEVASIWDIAENQFVTVSFNPLYNYDQIEQQLNHQNLPRGIEATKENIEKASGIVKDHGSLGSTNIIAGIEVGLFLIKRTLKTFPGTYKPMIIFLTDGLPNVAMTSADEITEVVTNLNSGKNRASIFSLSFGENADKKFLEKLSSRNSGYGKHIFEAADASLQLQGFYRQISSPLLSDVTFKYADGVVDVTNTHFPTLFNGSELVVAGRTSGGIQSVLVGVDGVSQTGPMQFTALRQEPVSSLERLWAYLTVKQILKESETTPNKTELTKRALGLALKYSFVTSLTSLVVVKPDSSDSVDSKPSVPGEEHDDNNQTPARGRGRHRGRAKTRPASKLFPSYDTSDVKREESIIEYNSALSKHVHLSRDPTAVPIFILTSMSLRCLL